MSTPIPPRLPGTALRSRHPAPIARTDTKARLARPAATPGASAAGEAAPVRDLLTSLGF